MRTFKLTLAYDGTDFAGWQVQSQRRTVQGTLEKVLAKITGGQVAVAGSGRTDAGVHALAQVASLESDTHLSADVLRRALNAYLPPDLRVLEAEDAHAGFHARRDALRKRYRYVIVDGPLADVFTRHYAWHVPPRLDIDAIRRAAEPLVGQHDFRSFETHGARRVSSVRNVMALEIRRDAIDARRLTLEVEADGFLYNMVRTIVGTLVEVGRGARPESWPGEALAATNRRAAGPTAPPQGLFLVRVEYAQNPQSPTSVVTQ